MFHIIDIAHWERAEYYDHFLKQVPCAYHITANVDITALYKTVKRDHLKFIRRLSI